MGIEQLSEDTLLIVLPEDPQMSKDLEMAADMTRADANVNVIVDMSLVEIMPSPMLSELMILEKQLGDTIHSFCYPNGDNDARTRQAVRDAGYVAAVTTSWGQNAPGSDALALRRYDMVSSHVRKLRGSLSEASLMWRMSGLYPGLG